MDTLHCVVFYLAHVLFLKTESLLEGSSFAFLLSPVYTIQPVVKPVVKPTWKPVWQPVVSCKRGITIQAPYIEWIFHSVRKKYRTAYSSVQQILVFWHFDVVPLLCRYHFIPMSVLLSCAWNEKQLKCWKCLSTCYVFQPMSCICVNSYWLLVLVHGQVTIIFEVSVCLFACFFVCAEFFSAVFDPISVKLGHMLCVWV